MARSSNHHPWRVRVATILLAMLTVAIPTLAQDAGTPDAAGATIAPYRPGTDPASLSGRVLADGSSTVWPVTIEIAEQFAPIAENVEVEVEVSGTGGGFRRFCDAASDIQNASRPISAEEQAACAGARVAYHEFTIGFDGITIVVNPENTFVECLTVDQLRRLWQPANPARTWRELDPAWPDQAIDLFGPGIDSGTFDYFTQAIVGEAGVARDDFTASEIDFVLVEEVATDQNALGYFGYAYFLDTQDRLRAVAVDAGAGCVFPSAATIADGSYRPLARPIFIYASRPALAQPEVQEFTRFYLATAKEAVQAVGYVPTDDATYAANQAELEGAIAGTIPADGPPAGSTPTP